MVFLLVDIAFEDSATIAAPCPPGFLAADPVADLAQSEVAASVARLVFLDLD